MIYSLFNGAGRRLDDPDLSQRMPGELNMRFDDTAPKATTLNQTHIFFTAGCENFAVAERFEDTQSILS